MTRCVCVTKFKEKIQKYQITTRKRGSVLTYNLPQVYYNDVTAKDCISTYRLGGRSKELLVGFTILYANHIEESVSVFELINNSNYGISITDLRFYTIEQKIRGVACSHTYLITKDEFKKLYLNNLPLSLLVNIIENEFPKTQLGKGSRIDSKNKISVKLIDMYRKTNVGKYILELSADGSNSGLSMLGFAHLSKDVTGLAEYKTNNSFYGFVISELSGLAKVARISNSRKLSNGLYNYIAQSVFRHSDSVLFEKDCYVEDIKENRELNMLELHQLGIYSYRDLLTASSKLG